MGLSSDFVVNLRQQIRGIYQTLYDKYSTRRSYAFRAGFNQRTLDDYQHDLTMIELDESTERRYLQLVTLLVDYIDSLEGMLDDE